MIADRQNISIRSVERIDKKLWRVFDGSANGKPLDETIRRALIDGVCEAISESITADDKAEQADFNNRRIASINDFGKLIAEKEGAQKSVK